jgi:hypothetical protein
LAPSLPKAVRVFLDKCAIVLFRRAALAAFVMFRFAAVLALALIFARAFNCFFFWHNKMASPLAARLDLEK